MQAEEVTKIEVTEVLDASRLNLIRITNAFNPREFVREQLDVVTGQSLAIHFPIGSVESVVSINGKIIPADEYAVTYPAAGDCLVICPIPQKGGGGKQILSLVAMIAVAVFATPLAGAINTGLGLGLTEGSMGLAMLTAGVTLAGSLLVHTIFAPSKATNASANSSNGTTTSTYGIDGAKNTSLEGVPVPVCYGRFRMAGNIVAMHVDNEGDNQTLYMLINAGEGPITGIVDVEINDNPLSDYIGVEAQVRVGGDPQEVIPWFAEQITPFNLSAKLSTNWTNYTTVANVDRLRLDFVAPNGLFQVDKKTGDSLTVTVPLEIQYATMGSGAWKTLAAANLVQGTRAVVPLINPALTADGTNSSANGWIAGVFSDGQGNTWQIQPDGTAVPPGGNTAPISTVVGWTYADTGGAVSADDLAYINANHFDQTTPSPTVPVHADTTTNGAMSAAQRSAVRRSYDSGALISGKYDVRARRVSVKSTDDTVSDEVYLSDVNEIVADPVAYNNTALLGLKIKLGDQITGLPKVTFVNGGKLISVNGRPIPQATTDSWYQGPSSNPAWVMWDILTNRRYGGGMQTSRLDFYSFKTWADYCDANALTWNGPLDTQMNVWDATQYVLRVGHGQLVNVGTLYMVVFEAPATPVMMFSVANMVRDSYSETWLGVTDRANEVDVTFFDSQDKYKQRTIKIYDPVALTAGQPQRTSAVTLYGIVDYDRAYREGMFMMNLNRFVLKTVKFQAPLESIACTVGDVVLIQHDMTNWAQAGRCGLAGTQTQLVLDRPVTMANGAAYSVMVLHDYIWRGSATISNIIGGTVFIPGYVASNGGTRLRVVGGLPDIEILQRFDGSVALNNVVGLAVGQAIEIFDTDVIEEIGVQYVAGDSTTINLVGSLMAPPIQYTNWMFGETAKVRKPFRIKSITGVDDYTREIQGVQYDDQVYDFTRFASQHVPIANPATDVISEVRNLEIYEETRVAGTQMVSEVVASWVPPYFGLYAGADVYARNTGEANFGLYGTINHGTNVTIPAIRGDVLTVKVVAFDIYGHRAVYGDAPEATLSVVGEITAIDVGDVTGADVIWSGRDCRLTWRYNSGTHSYEFGSEPVGADAGSLDPQFKDYEISVWHTSDAPTLPPRRIEHTGDNSYTYTYDKNFIDGLERNLRFQIRMRDIFNNLGAPTLITAYNPPPRLTSFSVTPTFESAMLVYQHSNDADFAGAMIWVSDTSADIGGNIYTIDPKFLVYNGPDTQANITHLIFDQAYYARVACYDAFGATELLPSNVMTFRTTVFDVAAIADGVLADSKLIPALQSRINLIDGPDTMPNSVNQRIQSSLSASSLPNNRIFREPTMPVSDATYTLRVGDVWYNTANQNKPYVWDGTQWVLTDDGSIQTVAASVTTVEQTVIGVCMIGGSPSDHTNKSWCESAGGTWLQGIPFASAVKQVSVFNGTNNLTIEQNMTAQGTVNGGLQGQYTLKLQENNYIAGFGFALYDTNANSGQPVSEFVILTDRFAIVSPAGAPGQPQKHPFTVGPVNGIQSVIMDRALIGDATIGSAMIGDAVIKSAHIGFLEVKEGNIGASAVSGAPSQASNGQDVSFSIQCPADTPSIMLIANSGTYLDGGTGSGDPYAAPGEASTQNISISASGGGLAAQSMYVFGNVAAINLSNPSPGVAGVVVVSAHRNIPANFAGWMRPLQLMALVVKK